MADEPSRKASLLRSHLLAFLRSHRILFGFALFSATTATFVAIHLGFFSTLFIYLPLVTICVPALMILDVIDARNARAWAKRRKIRFGLCLAWSAFLLLAPTYPTYGRDSYMSAPIPRLPKNETYFIAANLYDYARHLPSWTKQMDALIQHLGPQNVFLSIYESNSHDKTKAMLRDFEAHLERGGVRHRILMETDDRRTAGWTSDGHERVQYMADMRNKALEPLRNATKVIFFNDVYFEWKSIVRLLNTHNGEYDLACALDFDGIGLYDTWVIRDGCGHRTKEMWPYFSNDPVAVDRLRNDQPVEVATCWNGVAAFDSRWFLSNNPLRFRDDPRCAESECFLIGYDMHVKTSPSRPRVYVNPQVNVAYTPENWLYYGTLKHLSITRPWRVVWEDWIGYRLFGWVSDRIWLKDETCPLEKEGLVKAGHCPLDIGHPLVPLLIHDDAVQAIRYACGPHLRRTSPSLIVLPIELSDRQIQVRGLSTPADDLILSASRDSTAIVWRRDPSSSSPASAFTPATVYHPSTRFVNAVTYLPPTPEAPKGYAVAGDQDGVISVYALEPTKDEPDFMLLGHTGNVCALHTTPGGAIVSSSWDHTARVWRDFNAAFELKGHEDSVWDAIAVSEDEFITASADKSIKLWKQHKVVQTLPATGVVRSLALIPDIGFASCSDNEIRVWTLGGDLVHTLNGHTSFIYQLAVLPNGDLVSSSEDRSVRIWKDGECAQVLVHPAISVWTVSTMPNGDIVSGASDKNVRVFSAVEERWAPAHEIKAYDDVIAQQSLASHDVEQVKVEPLDALKVSGKKAGQTLLVSNGDVTEVYQWDGSVWQRIGERAEAPSGNAATKTYFEGKEWDYVWNVALEDGEPSLKLPYNVSENPTVAANRFLERNNLSPNHLNTIVEYIYQNTGGQTLGGGGEQYSDPFTGATRYQSNAASGGSGPAASYVDPYTGASRYVSSTSSSASAPSSAYMDPYTGASRYSGQPAPAKPVVNSILPYLQPVLLKEGNLTAMRAKLQQYDDHMRHEISTSALALYPEEERAIDEAFSYVQKASAGSRPTKPLGNAHIDAIVGALDRWHASFRLPVLDLARLVVAYCPESVQAPGVKERFFSALFKSAEFGSPWVKPTAKPVEVNLMLVFRALANVMQEGAHTTEGSWLTQVLQLTSGAHYAELTTNQRKGRATMLLNISCITLFNPLPSSARSVFLGMILEALKTESSDTESAYRALVGLGNLYYASKQQNSPLDAAQTAEIKQVVSEVASRFSEERIRNMAAEISSLL
ncbi:unnamed protein product [Mycena citricolor]|uniref:Uncharacterized protein n=1 Tax=Mycena citricolor TaxID=2018698 RepID=A0AAD2GZ63_9AGAR|nr:unnamed protein product [Mycena citricolor]